MTDLDDLARSLSDVAEGPTFAEAKLALSAAFSRGWYAAYEAALEDDE